MADSDRKPKSSIPFIIGFLFFGGIFVYLFSDMPSDSAVTLNSDESNFEDIPKATNPVVPADVAICIVYDTSGSMNDNVQGKNGPQPKYMIANRALVDVIDILQKYVDNGSKGGSHTVYAGLVTFNGISCPLIPFNSANIKQWLTGFSKPNGGTPLGNAILIAGKELLKINAVHKHILVLTDGRNTEGSDPSVVIPQLKKEAQSKGSLIDVHIIGFNVQDQIFAPLKLQGVNVFSAVDEKELTMQLDTLLKTKILLEDDEAPTSSTPLK